MAKFYNFLYFISSVLYLFAAICDGAGLGSIVRNCFLDHIRNNDNDERVLDYLNAQPLIDDIHTFDHWTSMRSDVMQLVKEELGQAIADRFEFISLKEFKQELIQMGEWLVQQGINDEDSAVAIEIDGKSSGWVMANLMAYTNVKPKNFVTLGKKYLHIKKLFFVDDASYSGLQMKGNMGEFIKYHSAGNAKVIIGVPFISKKARSYIKGWSFNIKVYDKAHIIRKCAEGKFCLVFEHKVADVVSLPSGKASKGTLLPLELEKLYLRHVGNGERFPPYKMMPLGYRQF